MGNNEEQSEYEWKEAKYDVVTRTTVFKLFKAGTRTVKGTVCSWQSDDPSDPTWQSAVDNKVLDGLTTFDEAQTRVVNGVELVRHIRYWKQFCAGKKADGVARFIKKHGQKAYDNLPKELTNA